MSRRCALSHVSRCCPGLSCEHYISAAVLDLIFDNGNGLIQGTPFAPQQKPMTINALTARTLCKLHNCDLSVFDEVGRDALAVLQRIQIEYSARDDTSWSDVISGDLFEKWLLKVVFGMWFGGVLAANEKKIGGAPPAN